ncbi:hypothetical protein [Vallicoccus soli]|uniref:Uncharacterized protein n=1 Tax=Vallicoccus soli TaxID=2339232 RepID=A0A3A3YPW6_9ACTN|nr:hypothetical protein [Vallicoccus soli]RJK92641.1 hypothetical protein D5H78_18585 [Vallicoccus soli]
MTRHPLDLVALLFGAAFLATAGVALADGVLGLEADADWVLPVLLLVVGAVGLLGSLSRLGREAGRPRDDGPPAGR